MATKNEEIKNDGMDNFLSSLQKQEKNSLIAVIIAASLINATKGIDLTKIDSDIINNGHNFKIMTKEEDLQSSQILKITNQIYSNIYQHLSTELKGQVPQDKIADFAQELSLAVESKLKEQAFIAVNNAVSSEISDELIIELNKIIEQEIAKKIILWQQQGYAIRDTAIKAITVTSGGGVIFTGKLAWCSLQDCEK